MMAVCSEDGCAGKVLARGLCPKHYHRIWKKGGLTPVRSPDGHARKFVEDVALMHKGDDCLTWPYPLSNGGYGRLYVDGRNLMAHRYVCERAHGAPPTPEHEAAHSCGKGHLGCVAPCHLSWKTPAENQADRIVHGTDMRGEKHWAAKLTAEQVLEIRALEGKHSSKVIGEMFGISPTQTQYIIKRKSWSHISESIGDAA